jgi:general stress protein 26
MATQKTEFDGDLWFFTSVDSAKADEIRKERQVNVSYAEPSDQRYVSLSGMARVVRDRAKAEELWNPMVKVWFPKGIDDPELALLHVTVDKGEYWDAPAGKMVQLFGLVKAVATGKRYEPKPDEHQKVDLQTELAGSRRE